MNKSAARNTFLAVGLALAGLGPQPVEATPVASESDFHHLRHSIGAILRDMAERPDLFPLRPLERPRVLALETRDEVRRVWATAYDRLLALEAIADANAGLRFPLHHAADLAHYRYALDWIERVERDPALDPVLNEADPGLGLPAQSYKALKDRILHVKQASEFASKRLIDRMAFDSGSVALEAAIRADADRIWEMGRGPGPRLSALHAARRAEGAATHAALPLQEHIARGMAEIRVRRVGSALVSEGQIAALHLKLEPGDILLTRREWYVSNVGIPGFWSHAALYVGSADERRTLSAAPEVRKWVVARGEPSGEFERLLVLPPPSPLAKGGPPRVLEAIAEGVAFTSLERAAHADSVAVLRPRLDRVAKARAVWRAFQYAGRPYDYNFDFRTDDTFVCSELIYKAYRELPGERGLALPLSKTLGRPMISPNEIARLFAQDEKPRFELVAFLDGDERAQRAHERGVEGFRDTWARPKWHILLPVDREDPRGAGSRSHGGSQPATHGRRAGKYLGVNLPHRCAETRPCANSS